MEEQISNNFTLKELTSSSTAKRLKIDNTPTQQEYNNLVRLVKEILQPIRNKYGKPIIISSGFRNKKLNKAVGGVSSSQHLTGQAADIHSVSDSRKDNKELFILIEDMIKKGEIKVGQLINEYNYDWIHISLPTSTKLNQIFKIG